MKYGRKPFHFRPDDGLGGSAGAATQVPAGDTDPILEEPGYLADGGEFAPDPGNTVGDGDPWAGVPQALREAAEAKGLKTPEDFARSWQEAQSLIGRRDESAQTVTQLQQERDALLAALEQRATAQGGADGSGGGQQGPAGDWTVDFEALANAAGGDPIEAMKLYHENVVPQMLQDFGTHLMGIVDQNVSGKVAPLERHTSSAMLKEQAQTLAREFPADFPKHKDDIVRLVQARPEYQGNPNGLKLAFYEIIATEKARADAVARGNEGEMLTGGRGVNPNGRRPPRDVAAETRAAIEGAIGGIADGLS